MCLPRQARILRGSESTLSSADLCEAGEDKDSCQQEFVVLNEVSWLLVVTDGRQGMLE
jgi:hypothetical protein